MFGSRNRRTKSRKERNYATPPCRKFLATPLSPSPPIRRQTLLKQEVRSVELGVCPMQLFLFLITWRSSSSKSAAVYKISWKAEVSVAGRTSLRKSVSVKLSTVKIRWGGLTCRRVERRSKSRKERNYATPPPVANSWLRHCPLVHPYDVKHF